MPELPEVETVRRGLSPYLLRQRLAHVALGRPDLRFPFPPRFAERLTGRVIQSLDRRGKYLLAGLDDDTLLLMHLGMSGRFAVLEGTTSTPRAADAGLDPAHHHVCFELQSGTQVVFNDPRRFGFMELIRPGELASNPHLASLGPEPLAVGFTADVLAQQLAGRSTSIKAALLDQRRVAGLGNIYVCEALYRARLSPRRKAGSVTGQRSMRLAGAIQTVLNEAIAAGGSTLRDYRAADGSLGYFQHNFKVYGREGEPCGVCGKPIKRLVQSGRSTFYCPGCQR